MGYYTYHTLSMESESPINARAIFDYAQENKMEFVDGFRLSGNDFETTNEIKWYEHEKEMRNLSKHFPDILFILHGEGEERGDIWDEYYRAGKMQHCHAEVKIPPYNPDNMM